MPFQSGTPTDIAVSFASCEYFLGIYSDGLNLSTRGECVALFWYCSYFQAMQET